MTSPEIIGLTGVGLMLIAYAGGALERLRADGFALHALNLAGALCVLYSLLFDFNLPAFLFETAWAGVAAWGVVRNLTQSSRDNA